MLKKKVIVLKAEDHHEQQHRTSDPKVAFYFLPVAIKISLRSESRLLVLAAQDKGTVPIIV